MSPTAPKQIWCVYSQEWLAVYSSDMIGLAGRNECQGVYIRRYEGRIREHDTRLQPWSETSSNAYPWMLELRLWNLRGEFVSQALGERFVTANNLAADGPDRAPVVRKNSAADRALREYGQKMLPAEKAAGT